MAEQMRGALSDYIRRPEGTYDPWAAAITGFVGGAQYGADRRAVEAERGFTGEVRDRQRAEWENDDAHAAGAKKIMEQFSDVSETPSRPLPANALIQQGAPAPAAAPADPIGGALGAVGQMTGTAPATPPMGAPPGGLPAAAPAQGGAAALLKSIDSPKMTRDLALRNYLLAGNDLRYGKYEQGMQKQEAALEQYSKYANLGASEFLSAAFSGDPAGVAAARKKYPDLYDGLFHGDYVGPIMTDANTDPTGVARRVHVIRAPDGTETRLSDDDMARVAYQRASDKRDLQTTLTYSLNARIAEVSGVQNKVQQDETTRRDKRQEDIEVAKLYQQQLAAKSGDRAAFVSARDARLTALTNAKVDYFAEIGGTKDGGLSASPGDTPSLEFVGTGKGPVPVAGLFGPKSDQNPSGMGLSKLDINNAAGSVAMAYVNAGSSVDKAEAAQIGLASLALQRGLGASAVVQVGDTPVKVPPTVATGDRFYRLAAVAGPYGPINVVSWIPRTSNDPRLIADPANWRETLKAGNFIPLRSEDSRLYTEARMFGAQGE